MVITHNYPINNKTDLDFGGLWRGSIFEGPGGGFLWLKHESEGHFLTYSTIITLIINENRILIIYSGFHMLQYFGIKVLYIYQVSTFYNNVL